MTSATASDALTRTVEAKLTESGVLARAARSALYRRAWGADVKRYATITTYEGLRALPFVAGSDLRCLQLEADPAAWTCADHVRLWISTSGTTGSPKWIPIADADLEEGEESADNALMSIGLYRPDRLAFGLNAPAPYYTDMLAYTALPHALRRGLLGQGLVASIAEIAHCLEFALRQDPGALCAFPSVAMALAEGMIARLPELIGQLVPRPRWLARPLAYLLQRVLHIRPRHLFHLRWGAFGGEPLAPYRQAIREAWGMESIEVYGLSELRGGFSECEAQQGIHIWLHRCLPEVIPLVELEREKQDSGPPPVTQPLWQSPPGLVGELVLTSYGHAFPLVRYRTGDLIEVVDSAPCPCGRPDPRLRVLHRVDDIVNLGIVRFSLIQLGELLAQPGPAGVVADWQIHVTRTGYKPLLVLLLRPNGPVDGDAFLAQARTTLMKLKPVREGLASGVIAPPEIRLVEDLVPQRTSSGKVRRLIYERISG
ncbi:MAG: phenylacetate--CoA ligase family protein [Anaerolineae bacterium]